MKVRQKSSGRVGTVNQVYPSGMVEVWFTNMERKGLTTATFMPSALEPVDVEQYETTMVDDLVNKICQVIEKSGLPTNRLYEICQRASARYHDKA